MSGTSCSPMLAQTARGEVEALSIGASFTSIDGYNERVGGTEFENNFPLLPGIAGISDHRHRTEVQRVSRRHEWIVRVVGFEITIKRRVVGGSVVKSHSEPARSVSDKADSVIRDGSGELNRIIGGVAKRHGGTDRHSGLLAVAADKEAFDGD